MGPVSFIIAARDLRAITPGNSLLKYADDTYLLVPSSNNHSIPAELSHINIWAASNNLTINSSKSKEIIFSRRKKIVEPPPLDSIERVDSINVLGVLLTKDLRMTEHVNNVVAKANSSLYAVRKLPNCVKEDLTL